MPTAIRLPGIAQDRSPESREVRCDRRSGLRGRMRIVDRILDGATVLLGHRAWKAFRLPSGNSHRRANRADVVRAERRRDHDRRLHQRSRGQRRCVGGVGEVQHVRGSRCRAPDHDRTGDRAGRVRNAGSARGRIAGEHGDQGRNSMLSGPSTDAGRRESWRFAPLPVSLPGTS